MNLLKIKKFDNDQLNDDIYYYYLYSMEPNQIKKLFSIKKKIFFFFTYKRYINNFMNYIK